MPHQATKRASERARGARKTYDQCSNCHSMPPMVFGRLGVPTGVCPTYEFRSMHSFSRCPVLAQQ
eukprot:15447755-Alexandrium_andersonii.AAC.1